MIVGLDCAPVTGLTAQQARALVMQGICPFCMAGPFCSIANHTYPAHGVDCIHLRDIMEVPYRQSICDPAHAARCAERAIARGDTLGARRRHPGVPYRTSAAKARAQKAAGVRMSRASVAAARLRAQARDALIIQLTSEASLRQWEIAKAVGANHQTVRAVQRRAGLVEQAKRLRGSDEQVRP
jgi:hypothetical protein